MNPDVLADIQRRLIKLESIGVRYRAGEITDTGPLEVALGGSSVPYVDIKTIAPSLQTGDQVAVLVFGNDLLVLGPIQGGETAAKGSDSATWTGSERSATVTVAHGLAGTPTFAQASSRDVDIAYAVTGRDATNITVRGRYLPGTAIGTTHTFDWKAEL